MNVNLELGSNKKSDDCKHGICNLPDEILEKILSFLPTKDAVRTSILSKRWQFLWTSIPNLYLDLDRGAEEGTRWTDYMNFVERALLLHESSYLETFSLRCILRYGEPPIGAWIGSALRQKVKRLLLFLGIDDEVYNHDPVFEFKLPQCLFTCDTLEELILSFCCPLMLPPFICFPSLEILTLAFIDFMDHHLVELEQLISGCPCLKKLVLHKCTWTDLQVVHISSPMLEDLNIFEHEYEFYESSCNFIISGMRLKYFGYRGTLREEYCIVDAPSLVGALVRAWVPANEEGRQVDVSLHAHRLLRGFEKTLKYLCISCGTPKVLTYAEEDLATHPPRPIV